MTFESHRKALLCFYSINCAVQQILPWGDGMKKGIYGAVCGLLNGLFGSGGGVAAVPLLERLGLEARSSHATSVALIFFLSLASTVLYACGSGIAWRAAFSYMPTGLLGAVVGAAVLKRINNDLLRRIFGVLILVSSVRILLQ